MLTSFCYNPVHLSCLLNCICDHIRVGHGAQLCHCLVIHLLYRRQLMVPINKSHKKTFKKSRTKLNWTKWYQTKPRSPNCSHYGEWEAQTAAFCSGLGRVHGAYPSVPSPSTQGQEQPGVWAAPTQETPAPLRLPSNSTVRVTFNPFPPPQKKTFEESRHIHFLNIHLLKKHFPKYLMFFP